MPLPVLNIAQMREWENASWAAGRSQAAVIRRVGEVLAQKISALTARDEFILLLAGKGHNGDDVRAAKDFLADRRVELLDVAEPQNDLPRLEALLAQKPALIVDGLFGIGLDRALDDGWKNFIGHINAANRRVLAVDVPSGLNADTGEPQPAAVRAEFTLAIGAVKHGLLKPAAWPFTGRVEIPGDVGLIPCGAKCGLNWILPEDFSDFPPRREAAAHKGDFGHVAVVAGSLGFHGAAVLAVRGAQRARPGLVTVFPQENIFHAVAAQLQSAMVAPWRANFILPENASAVVFGPGLAAPGLPEELKATMLRLWVEAKIPVVVDASALAWLPFYPLRESAPRVVTPHPGEAARLLKTTVEKIQADRPAALRQISRQYSNCWVVLKGHQTLVGRADGDIFVNSSGNPHLAQGGSGDLLAGFLAGLIAQPALQTDPLKTICYAVWQHGAAADTLTREKRNWVVEDLAGAIGGI